MKFLDSLKRIALALALAAAVTGGQLATHDAHAQSQQYQVKISQLPVPAAGSTFLSSGDVVAGNRNNVTYGLIIGFGAGCTAHQWVNAISPQGFGTCLQPAYSDISGLGTAAAANIGTSGSTVPFLNGNLTWSGSNVFTGTIPALSNGNLALGASTTAGAKLAGQGATFDFTLQNKTGGAVCTVATGTTNLNCAGLQVGGVAVLTSGGTTGTFLGSSTTANPQVSGAPTSGLYTDGTNVYVEVAGAKQQEWTASGTLLGTVTSGVWNGTAIANANLANSSITVSIAGSGISGGGSVSLGGVTTITGLQASTTTFGASECDGTTITCAGGVMASTSTGGSLPGTTTSNQLLVSTSASGTGAWVTAIPSATTATTQATSDASALLATTSFVKQVSQFSMMFGSGATQGAASTTYNMGLGCMTTGYDCPVVAIGSGTLKNMFVQLVTAPGSGHSVTATINIGGGNGNQTCTISNTASSCQDTTHTDAYSGMSNVMIVMAWGASATSSFANGAIQLSK